MMVGKGKEACQADSEAFDSPAKGLGRADPGEGVYLFPFQPVEGQQLLFAADDLEVYDNYKTGNKQPLPWGLALFRSNMSRSRYIVKAQKYLCADRYQLHLVKILHREPFAGIEYFNSDNLIFFCCMKNDTL
jgi:hypothetical protein